MAAILQLRQGSTSTYISQGANVGEPFFDTGSNILVVGKSSTEVIKLTKLDESNAGSFSITGDLTASNAILSGDITIGGNIILGDAVQDNITISGQFDSDLIPSASGEYDLGSETKKWNNIFAVSGSIDSIDLTSNLPSGLISGSSQLPSGIISGSSQLPSGIISGSEQLPSSIVSSSQQVIDFLPDGVVSGSSQITDGSGIVSQSQQIDAGLVTNFDLEVKNKMNLDGVLSGSGQLPDGVVSGSQQIIDSLPTGTISGSEQLPSGIISGSSQLPSGIISGSSQVIEVLPTNTISGSSQISELTHLHSFTSSYNNAISLNGDDVTILGDLVVQGTQTQLNTETLNIEDKNLLIASGAADSSAADGAGITIDGADKSLQWEHSTTQFVFDAQVSSSVGFKGDGSNLTGLTADSVEFADILNKPTLVSGSDQVTGLTSTNLAGSFLNDSFESWQNNNVTIPTTLAVQTRLDDLGVISGSSQVTGILFSQLHDSTTLLSSETYAIQDGILPTTATIEARFNEKEIISGSSQVTGILFNQLDSSTKLLSTQEYLISDGVLPTTSTIEARFNEKELVSGSSQVLELLNGSGIVSGSSQLQSDYDIRYAPSSSLYTLIGNFPTSGSLGTAAFYNVSSSLADDPNVIPNVKAVYDYINNTIGAADITGVSASLGLSGGGDGGYVSLSLDTASAHFQAGVELYSSDITLPDGVVSGSIQIVNVLNQEGVISGSSQLTITESQISDLQSYLLRAPDGTVSGSSQTIDHIEASTLVAINQTSPSSLGTNGELIINGTTNGYSGIFTLESGSVKVYNHYGTESDKMINFLAGSGYGLYLQPDNTSTKAWVIDTDGDFVSQGTGDVYTENLYSTNAISGSSLSLASDATIAGNVNITGTLTADSISGDVTSQLPSGSVSSSIQIDVTQTTNYSSINQYSDSLVKTKLNAEQVLSGSSQVDVTATTNYSSINQYTDTDNTDHLNLLGVVSGSSQVDVTATTNYSSVVQTSGNQSIGGNKTFSNNVIISGDLNVAGTTTYTSTNNVNIGDNILELNFGGSATTGGILVKDATGTTTSGSLIWDSSTDNWKAGALGSESPIVRTTDLDYYTDSDNTSHLNSLGVISGSSQLSIGASQVTEISNLTADEGAQLENIGTTTISSTQWGYLGGLNQALTTTSDVDFGGVDIRDTGPTLILRDTDTSVLQNQVLGQIKFLHSDSGGGFSEVGVIKSVATEDFAGVDADSYKIHIDSNTIVNGSLESTGDIVAYASSDERLKDEIIPISNPLDKINSIGGYSFVWNSEKQNIYNGKDYGVIAQEIEEILPELVTTRENGYKAVKYDKIISLLIEGIKELSTEVKELKEKINRE